MCLRILWCVNIVLEVIFLEVIFFKYVFKIIIFLLFIEFEIKEVFGYVLVEKFGGWLDDFLDV